MINFRDFVHTALEKAMQSRQNDLLCATERSGVNERRQRNIDSDRDHEHGNKALAILAIDGDGVNYEISATMIVSKSYARNSIESLKRRFGF
jgi:hypothetical protein